MHTQTASILLCNTVEISHFETQTDSKIKVCKITSPQVHSLHAIHAPRSHTHGVTVLWVIVFAILLCLEASSTAVAKDDPRKMLTLSSAVFLQFDTNATSTILATPWTRD